MARPADERVGLTVRLSSNKSHETPVPRTAHILDMTVTPKGYTATYVCTQHCSWVHSCQDCRLHMGTHTPPELLRGDQQASGTIESQMSFTKAVCPP